MRERIVPLVLGTLWALASCGPDLTPIQKLTATGQYETAWKALDALPASDEGLERRIRLVLEGYTLSLNHQLFSLKDLAPGETVAALREAGGTFQVHALDVPHEVTAWTQAHGDSPRLDRALGDFYEDAYRHFGAYGTLDGPGTLGAARAAYDAAWKAGPFTGVSADAYAVVLLRLGAWEPAVTVLDRVLAATGESHPDAAYNRAFALLQAGKPREAAEGAARAVAGYPEASDLKNDALVLEADALAAAKENDQAAAVLAPLLAARDPRALERSIQWAVDAQDAPAAGAAALDYLNLTPGTPEAILKAWGLLEPLGDPAVEGLFQSARVSWADRPGDRGNLEALWAHRLLDLDKKTEAGPWLDRAEADWKAAGGITAEAKTYLAQLRSRL